MYNQRNKGTVLVLTTALISGFAIFINKFGIKGVDPYFYSFIKNVIAGALLISILFLTKNWRQIFELNKKDKIKLLLIAFVGGAVSFLLFFKGLTLTSAFKAGFIHKTMFVYVGFLAAVFLKEKITKSMILGFVSLFLGSILFLKIKPQALNIGDLYIFIAVLFWAGEIIISKRALKNISGTLVASARLFLGSFFILLFLFFTGRAELFGSFNWKIVGWAVIGGIILTAYNWTFYNGLKYIKASEATAILTLGMPITGILTVVFLDQSLGMGQLIGMGLILIGVILTSEFVKKIIGLQFKNILRAVKING